MSMHHYFIIYKPYRVLTQFSSSEGRQTLADFFDVPKDVYPVGRLDYDSEGLLILTNDTQLNHRLLHPQHNHEREYYVQVEGCVTQEAIHQLQQGVTISVDGKLYRTQQCIAKLFSTSPPVPERTPPIRYRKEIPTSWLSIILSEGKNRQVRKMTAKVGLPTLRLIRYRIEGITLEGLLSGDMRILSKQELHTKLFH